MEFNAETIRSNVKNNLLNCRSFHHISQRELGEKSSICNRTLKRCLNGEVNSDLDTAIKLLNGLRTKECYLSLDELTDIEDSLTLNSYYSVENILENLMETMYYCGFNSYNFLNLYFPSKDVKSGKGFASIDDLKHLNFPEKGAFVYFKNTNTYIISYLLQLDKMLSKNIDRIRTFQEFESDIEKLIDNFIKNNKDIILYNKTFMDRSTYINLMEPDAKYMYVNKSNDGNSIKNSNLQEISFNSKLFRQNLQSKISGNIASISQKTGIMKRIIESYMQDKNPSLANITMIAKALGVSIDWLIGVKEDEKIEVKTIYNIKKMFKNIAQVIIETELLIFFDSELKAVYLFSANPIIVNFIYKHFNHDIKNIKRSFKDIDAQGFKKVLIESINNTINDSKYEEYGGLDVYDRKIMTAKDALDQKIGETNLFNNLEDDEYSEFVKSKVRRSHLEEENEKIASILKKSPLSDCPTGIEL